MNLLLFRIKDSRSIEKIHFDKKRFVNLMHEDFGQLGIDNLEVNGDMINYVFVNKYELLSKTSFKASLMKGKWIIKEETDSVKIISELYISLIFSYICVGISIILAIGLSGYSFLFPGFVGLIAIVINYIIIQEANDNVIAKILKKLKNN
jgi:hypothetical protein